MKKLLLFLVLIFLGKSGYSDYFKWNLRYTNNVGRTQIIRLKDINTSNQQEVTIEDLPGWSCYTEGSITLSNGEISEERTIICSVYKNSQHYFAEISVKCFAPDTLGTGREIGELVLRYKKKDGSLKSNLLLLSCDN
jgi:hypothetical protein